jgi:hypothetical protein
MNKIVSAFICCVLISNALSQETIPVKGYFMNNFVFESGYWVYRDTLNNDIDSITLTNCIHNYVSPNPACPDYQEYFLMEFYSHSYDYSYNEYLITQFWKRNGGGYYGELGQPIMHIGQYQQYPEVGNGFNGYEIIDIIDIIEVSGSVYYDVVVSRVYEEQQYQYDFEYNTDLYFAPGVGIIREEYIDDLGNDHVWDLINYETNLYTGIDESSIENKNIILYPNPASGKVTVLFHGIESIEIYDAQGRSIIKSDCKCNKFEFNCENILQGMYFIKVAANHDVKIKKIVIE